MTKDKIVDLERSLEILKKFGPDKKVVFTNGCFDLIHLGHIDYLEKAKNLGDILIIGLNTDDSVRRIKGDNRPIIDEYSRARLLAALQFVDYVVFFDQDTPIELIEAIKPDILVKGNDYSMSNIVGADIVISYGGKVETIELVPGFSTSKLIEIIKEKNK